jgi:hypothetical protein
MSVIMTLRVDGDPEKVERYAQDHPDVMQSIIERAKGHGVIAHRFYGSEGEVLVVDEWPDAESFQQFFGESQAEIGPMMEAAGVTGEPEIRFWNKLETNDEVGWSD